MSNITPDRQYEIVLFGATGYTGALTAEHIAKYLPTNLRWAIAGRSAEKLETLFKNLQALNADRVQPDIQIASVDKESITSLVRQTKLIINCVGPFVFYGTPVVEACANNGTHYVDITGEFPWTYEMVQKYHETAKANGAIIIPQMGFESVPHDLLSWSLVTHFRETLSVGTKEVYLAIKQIPMVASGGSLATILAIFDVYDQSTILKASKAWAISPAQGRRARDPAGLLGVRVDPTLGPIMKSFLGSEANRAVVHRSWGLMGGGSVYGSRFHYFEYIAQPNRLVGLLTYLFAKVALLAFLLPPVRWLFRKFAYAPGSGPDVAEARSAKIELAAAGIADDDASPEHRALSTFNYTGGPYHLTGLLISEGAITILRDETLAKRMGGGFMTPATLGQPFLDRIAKAGVRIETKTV